MGMFELVKEFRSFTEGKDTPPSVKLLYYELLFEFNDNFWKTDLAYSERELSILTGMSKTAINKAINLLSDYGFIKVVRSHGRRTKFRLKSDHVPTCEKPLNDHKKTKKRPSALLSLPSNSLNSEDKGRLQDTRERETGAAASQKRLSEKVKNAFIAHYEYLDWNEEIALADFVKKYDEQMVSDAIETAFIKKPKRDMTLLSFIAGILRKEKEKGGVSSGNSNVKPETTDRNYKWTDPPDLDKYDV